MNEIIYVLFSYQVFKIQYEFYTHCTSQLRGAIFAVLKSHM